MTLNGMLDTKGGHRGPTVEAAQRLASRLPGSRPSLHCRGGATI
jgi:hypothetical protein